MQIFDTPDKIQAYRAIALKSALKLSLFGIQPGRGLTKKVLRRNATQFTGTTYGRLETDKAHADMVAYVAALTASKSAELAVKVATTEVLR